MNTTLRRVTTGALAFTAVMGALLAGAGTASAHQYGDRLYRGETLEPGESISRVGWRLVMQTDGNLVEYKTNSSGQHTAVCWASNTNTGWGNYAIYQYDGNFVVYNPWGQAVWASHTMGLPGQTVDINSVGRVYAGHTPISGAC
ncbi:hypothetical protein J7F03_19590 [Streptomyces sp. ISL-43]|uniref:hypothetical protein n=1 Tax=Streptomyces sp. ISL-43 TaxID=2819183 RepID=UPI001BEB304A|nr:hypothetical protein [Streptomyces sp. ISL-43]MBT2449256.1 hypothetical protein [Streptomyces sp. ISL-43]